MTEEDYGEENYEQEAMNTGISALFWIMLGCALLGALAWMCGQIMATKI